MEKSPNNKSSRAIALSAALAAAIFSAAAYWQFDGFKIFVPEAPVIGRFSGTMAFGFFATGGAIATIYCCEMVLAVITQRTLQPTLSVRLTRYPKVVTLLSALGSVALVVALRSSVYAAAQQ